MKKVMFGVVVMLISLAMISCDNKKLKIKEAAVKANLECPIDMGVIGAATSITYDEDMNEMVYEYELTEEYNDVKSLSENPEMMKRSAMMSFSSDSESLKTLADMMIEAGGGIKFVYHGLKSGATAEVSLNKER